jgi:hypothetical protein
MRNAEQLAMQTLDKIIELINSESDLFRINMTGPEILTQFTVNPEPLLSLDHYFDIYSSRLTWLKKSNPQNKLINQIELFLERMDAHRQSIDKIRLMCFYLNEDLIYVFTDEKITILLGLIGP